VGKKKRVWTREFKLAAIGRMAGSETICGLAQELGVRRELLYKWQIAYEAKGAAGLRAPGRPSVAHMVEPPWSDGVDDLAAARERIAALERKVGEQQVDLDFFRAALRQVRARRPLSVGRGETASTK